MRDDERSALYRESRPQANRSMDRSSERVANQLALVGLEGGLAIQLTSLILIPPGNRVDDQADQRVQRVHDQLIKEEPDDDGLLSYSHIIAEAKRSEEDRVVDEQTEGGEGDEQVDLTDGHEFGRVS
jgi:hypothetical protein